jgi:periplasmic protein TonB
METNKILNAHFLDILFDGKNKNYGAYYLRNTYNKRLLTALFAMAMCSALFVAISFLKNATNITNNDVKGTIVTILDFIDPPKIIEPKTPKNTPNNKAANQPKAASNSVFNTPKIVKDFIDPKKMEILPINDLGNKQIGNAIAIDDGINKGFSTVSKGTGGSYNPVIKNDDDSIFNDVQIESEFPGGVAAWRKYLEKTLNPSTLKDAGAPVGKYAIEVNFIVDAKGNISDIVANLLSGDEDFGAKQEAIKVIKNGPKWKPAIQNGTIVASRKKQMVVFLITEE